MNRLKGFFNNMITQNTSQYEKLLAEDMDAQCIFIQQWAYINAQKSYDEIFKFEQRLIYIHSFTNSKQEELEILKQISRLQNIQEIYNKIRSLASEIQQIVSILRNSEGNENKIEQSRVQLDRKICTLCYAIKNLKIIYAEEAPIQIVKFMDSMNKCYDTEPALQEYQIDKEIKELFKPFSNNDPKYLKYCQEFLLKNQLQDHVKNNTQYQPIKTPQYSPQHIQRSQQQSQNQQFSWTENFRDRNSHDDYKRQDSNRYNNYQQDQNIREQIYQQEQCYNFGDQQDISKIISSINKKHLRDPMKDDNPSKKHPEQSFFLQEIQQFQRNQSTIH
ncbi:hypothetical protein pb186bvf_017032 [Paramecium bursaria]